MTDVTVTPNDPKFEVEIFRGNASSSYTGSISATGAIGKTEFTDFTVSSFTFAEGEYKTTATVDISNLEIGEDLDLTLTLNDADNISKSGISETSLTCNKDYNWVSLGTGTYTDAFATGSDANPNGVTSDVEIYQAEGFSRYRVMAPYTAYLASDQGAADWSTWISANKAASYIEFYTVDDVVYFNAFCLGLAYQGVSTQLIYAYHPAAFSGLSSEHNKWVDSKTVQLAPYFYISGLGGWNYTTYDGVILITLP